MHDFLGALFSPTDLIELRVIGPQGRISQFWYDDFETVKDQAEVLMHNADVYVGVLPRNEPGGGGKSVDDYTHVLFADYDPKVLTKPGLFAAITGLSPKPQIVVDSGSGYHVYWLLDRSYPFADAQTVMRDIAAVTGGDTVHDKARILRLPGTLNYKTNPPKPVRLLRLDLLAPKHRLSDFYRYDQQFDAPKNGGMTFEDLYGPRQQSSVTNGWTPSTMSAPKMGPGERNNGLARLAGIMLAKGLDYDKVLASLLVENDIVCNPPLPYREVLAIARSMERYRHE